LTRKEQIKWLEEAAKRWCRYTASIHPDNFTLKDRHFEHAQWFVSYARRLKAAKRVKSMRED
jgi:hypothetical protein